MTVHKNGYITLGDRSANLNLEAGNVLQTADAPIIAALLGDTTDYDVTVFGTDRRNGRYIVQWHYEDGDRTIARFQTVLFDSDDTIETRYDIYDPDPTDEDAVFFRGLADGAGGAVNSAADLLDLRSGSRANFRPLYTHALLNLNESDANQFETSFPLSVVSQLARGRGVEPVSVLPLIDGVPERTRSYQLNLELSGDLEQPNPTTQIIVFDDDFDYLTATVSVNPPEVEEGLTTTVRIELGGSLENFRAGYEVTSTVIAGGYVDISANDDIQEFDVRNNAFAAGSLPGDAMSLPSLPFTFTLYGKEYSQVYISENGFIILANEGDEIDLQNLNLYLSNSFSQPELSDLPIIAPFWDDLGLRRTGLIIEISGDAPNRQFVVQWDRASFNSIDEQTFKLILEEGSSNIQFHYDRPAENIDGNRGSRGSTALVGIKGGMGDPIRIISDHQVLLDGDNRMGTRIDILTPDYLVLTIDDPTRVKIGGGEFPVLITGEHFTNGVYELELGYEANDEPEQDQERTLRLIGDPARTDSPLLQNEDTIATFTLRDGVSNVGLELTEQRVREGFDTTLILSLSQPLPSSGNYSPTPGIDPERISIGSGSGRLNNINSSNKFETVDIGFEFEFYGNTYSSLQVAEDGILVFTEDNLIVDDERDLAGAAYPIIAPFWADLNLGFGNPEVHTRLRGNAPNRSFIVEWIGLSIVEGEANSRANFQVTLRERSGDVEFYYYGLNGAGSDGSVATIGVSNGQGRFAQFEESVSNGTLLTFEAPRLEIALTNPATSENDLLDSFPIYITPREISDGYRRTITALNDGIPEEIETHTLQINEHGRLPIVINEARRVVEIEVSDNVPLASLELLTPRTVSEGETATLRVTVDSELRGVNVAYSGGIVSRPLEEIATLPGISEIPFDQFDMGGLSRDENAQNRDIGFRFEFYGEYYNSLAVGIDGFLVFPEDTRDVLHTESPNRFLTPNNSGYPTIAPLFTDLYLVESETSTMEVGSRVYDITVGKPGDRRYIVFWENLGVRGSDDRVSFQVVLSESDGEIQFLYAGAYDARLNRWVTNGRGLSVEVGGSRLQDGQDISFEAPRGLRLRADDGSDFALDLPLIIGESTFGGRLTYDIQIGILRDNLIEDTEIRTLSLSTTPFVLLGETRTVELEIIDRPIEVTARLLEPEVDEGDDVRVQLELADGFELDSTYIKQSLTPYLNYTLSSDLYTYTSIVTSGVTRNHSRGGYAIGFDFEFYGQTYDHYRYDGNGYITLYNGSDTPSTESSGQTNHELSSTNGILSQELPRIVPFWDSFDSGAYNYFGRDELRVGPEGKYLILEFNGKSGSSMDSMGNEVNLNTINYQVVLYENTNDIEFRYGDVTVSDDSETRDSTSATIGIKDGVTGEYVQYSHNRGDSENEEAALADNTRLTFSPSLPPTNYTIHRNLGEYNYESIATSTLEVNFGAMQFQPIGFDFEFYGQTYSHYSYSGYGYLTLSDKADNRPAGILGDPNHDLGSTEGTLFDGLPRIAPFWSTNNLSVTNVMGYGEIQDGPDGQYLVLEFQSHYTNGGTISYQVALYENTNEIEFRYGEVSIREDNEFSNGNRSTIGIKDGGDGAGRQYRQFSHNDSSLHANSSILFTPPAPQPAQLLNIGGYTSSYYEQSNFEDIVGEERNEFEVDATKAQLLHIDNSKYNETRNIGFEFEFYGENGVTKHTQLSINENGYIFLLTDEVSANRVRNDISTSVDPNSASARNGLLESIDETPLGDKHVPIIIPFWDAFAVPDLDFVGGEAPTPFYIAYREGPQGRRLIIQWDNLELADGGGEVTFQLVLHENTNEIEFRYKDVTGDKFVGGAGATVGIVDSLGSFNQFSYNAPKLSDDSRVVFRPNGLVLELSNQEYSDDLIQPITIRGDEIVVGDGSSGLAELRVQTLSDGLGEGDEDIDLGLVAHGLPVNFDPPILTPRVIDDAPRISLEPITTSVAEGEAIEFRITASEPLDEIQSIAPAGYSYIRDLKRDVTENPHLSDISGEGNRLDFYGQNLAATPDVVAPVSQLRDIGFGFEFQGDSYGELVVSSNGYVTFDPTGAGSASTEPPAQFEGSEVGLAIAPLWLSLVPKSDQSSVFDMTIGEPGDRQYIIQWNITVADPGDGTLLNSVFQLVLHERDNSVEFHYGEFDLYSDTNPTILTYPVLIGFGYGQGRGLNVLSCVDDSVCTYNDNSNEVAGIGFFSALEGRFKNASFHFTPSYLLLRTDTGADFTALQYRDSAGEWVPGTHLIDLATLFADTPTLDVQLVTKRDLLLEGTERPIIELVVNEGSELQLANPTLELEINDKPINVELAAPASVREGENFNVDLSLSEPLPANTVADYLSYQYTSHENVAFEDVSNNAAAVEVMFDTDDSQVGWVQYIDLDFDFQFYGNTHDTVFASASGFLAFTGGRTWTAVRRDDRKLTTNYQDLSRGIDGTPLSDIAPNEAPTGYPTIAPFWSHLDATVGEGTVYYLTRGEAPNRELIVQWDRVRVDVGVSTNVTFQAILRESGGIEFRYMGINGDPIVGTIGVTDGTDNDGINNGLFTQVGFETTFPTAGQAYRFEPPLLEIAIEPEVSGEFNPIFPIRINPNEFGGLPTLERTITVEDTAATQLADYTLSLGLAEGYSRTLALGQAEGRELPRVGLLPTAEQVPFRVLPASQVSLAVDLTAATDGVYEDSNIVLELELSDSFATDRDILRVSVDSPDDFDGFTSTIINSALFDQSGRATLSLLISEDNEFEGTEIRRVTIETLPDSGVVLEDIADEQFAFEVFDNIALATLSVSPRTIVEGEPFEVTVQLNTRPRPNLTLNLIRIVGELPAEPTIPITSDDFDSNNRYSHIFTTDNTIIFEEDVTHLFTLISTLAVLKPTDNAVLVVGSDGQPTEQVTVEAIVTDTGGLPQLSLRVSGGPEFGEFEQVVLIVEASELLAPDHLSGTIEIIIPEEHRADFNIPANLLSFDSTEFISKRSRVITLPVKLDSELEGAETVEFRLRTDPQAAVVANPDHRTVEVRLIDADTTRASLELSAPAILEGETVTLSIQLSEPLLDRDVECGPTFNHAGCTTNSYDENSGLLSGAQFEDIAQPGNELTLNTGKRATVELDFVFELYEVTHTIVTIAQNGFVSLGPNQFGSTEQVINNGDLTSPGELPGGHAQATIAPLWGQNPDAGTVYAAYLGEPGDANRRYVIQWNEIIFSTRNDSERFTFQLVLYENASDFEFRYDKATPIGDRDRFNHTIGVADGKGEFTRLAYVRTAVSANEGVEIKDDTRVRFSKALLSVDIAPGDGTDDFNRQFPIFLAPLLLGQKTATLDLVALTDSDREFEEIYQFELNFAPDAGFATGLNSERDLTVWDKGLTAADIELIPAIVTEGQTVTVRVTLSRDALSEPIVPADLQLRVSSPGILTETFPINLLDRFDGSDSIDLVYEIPHNLIPNSAQPLDFVLSVPDNGPVVIGYGGATATLTIIDYTVEARLELLTSEQINEGDTAQVRVTLDRPLRVPTSNALRLVADSPDQLYGIYPIDLSALLGSELTEIVLDITVTHDTILEGDQTINLELEADEQFAITLVPGAGAVPLVVVDRTRLTANLIIDDPSVPETEPIEVLVELSGPLGQGSNLVLDTADLVDRDAFEEQFPIDLGAISSSATEFTITLRPTRDYLSNQDQITLNLDSIATGSSNISFVNRAVDITIEDAVVGVDLRFLETEIAEGDIATLRITLTEPLNIPDELPRDYVSRILPLGENEFYDLVAEEGTNSENIENNRQVFDNVDIGFGFRVYDETATVVQIGAPGYIAFTDVDDLDNLDNQGTPDDLAQGSASTPQGNAVPTFAPYWTDNIATEQFIFTNNLRYMTVGDPGERRFIVQWGDPARPLQIGSSGDTLFSSRSFCLRRAEKLSSATRMCLTP